MSVIAFLTCDNKEQDKSWVKEKCLCPPFL